MIQLVTLEKKILKLIPELNLMENISPLSIDDVKAIETDLKKIKNDLKDLNKAYNELMGDRKKDSPIIEFNKENLDKKVYWNKNKGTVYEKALRKKISSLTKQKMKLAYRLKFHYNK